MTMNFNDMMRAWGRSFVAQFRFKIILLSLVPLVLSLLLWGSLMWWRLQTIFDAIQSYFANHNTHASTGDLLSSLGLLAFKTLVVPMLAMWMLLPLMIISCLLFIGLIVMPTISKHVGQRNYPHLQMKQGGSFLGSVGFSLSSLFFFVLAWIVSLPLIVFPPIYVFVQPLLWGWITYRIMCYDALSCYANVEERKQLVREHRPTLLLMGVIAGWVGSLPSLIWMGGALSVTVAFLFPILVSLAIWLYLVIFVFTGLWFQHYCLAALERMRTQAASLVPVAPVIQSDQSDQAVQTISSNLIIENER
jgi:hypothetical protein